VDAGLRRHDDMGRPAANARMEQKFFAELFFKKATAYFGVTDV
jgi:hypothetical protein